MEMTGEGFVSKNKDDEKNGVDDNGVDNNNELMILKYPDDIQDSDLMGKEFVTME
ncbi:hypothetical protein PanWU01x14_093210 [Parasponia andersonii]|uniref:Uncharacterized protein n=1 Tax=Parasponia andersonii TaxID=3476 RepID=A0A2P5D609_PARAD|nr:hypothetical protein PanWU01x14_093210 [Parasponia andersonii]